MVYLINYLILISINDYIVYFSTFGYLTWVSFAGVCCHCCLSSSDRSILCFGASNYGVDCILKKGMVFILFSVWLL